MGTGSEPSLAPEFSLVAPELYTAPLTHWASIALSLLCSQQNPPNPHYDISLVPPGPSEAQSPVSRVSMPSPQTHTRSFWDSHAYSCFPAGWKTSIKTEIVVPYNLHCPSSQQIQ